MSNKVQKKDYSIEACKVNFDITKPQPQLFVTPSFDYLIDVLYDFSESMAFKRGGRYGIEQAIKSANIATCEYDNGVQISGKFTKLVKSNGLDVYLQTEGPTALSKDYLEIENHGVFFHKEGFGAPLGKVKNFDFTNLNLDKCRDQGLLKSKKIKLEYNSGLLLNGTIKEFVLDKNKHVILISFIDCQIQFNDKVLFDKNWGQYDLVIGEKIISCFPGFADKKSFAEKKYDYKSQTIKVSYSESDKKMHEVYSEVANIRDSRSGYDKLKIIFEKLKSNDSQEWLLLIEICEIIKNYDKVLFEEIKNYLNNLSVIRNDLKKLISDGLKVL